MASRPPPSPRLEGPWKLVNRRGRAAPFRRNPVLGVLYPEAGGSGFCRYLAFKDQAAFRGASHEAQALAGCAVHPGAGVLARLAERWWTRYRVAAWLTETADAFIGLHPCRDLASNYPPLSRYLGLAPRGHPTVLWDTATDWPTCIECGSRRLIVAGYAPASSRLTEEAFLFFGCLWCCRAALDLTRALGIGPAVTHFGAPRAYWGRWVSGAESDSEAWEMGSESSGWATDSYGDLGELMG